MDTPQPQPTPETQHYWDGTAVGELRIQRCRACGRHYFYPRPFCPHCWSSDVEWTVASGTGRLISYVLGRGSAPDPSTARPVIALVQLDEGPRMMTNIVGVEPTPELIPLDAPVRVEFQRHGDVALPVFRLVAQGSARHA